LRWPSTDTSCVGAFGDPKLAALANNGGATQTMAIQTGSAAIDKGSCTDTSGATIATDQRGTARPIGLSCDVGAYESAFSLPTPTPTLTPTPAPTATPTPNPSTTLVGYWKLDEGYGTIAYSSAVDPVGHQGAIRNSPVWIDTPLPPLKFNYAGGHPSFALKLNNSDHQFVDVGTSYTLTNASFTLAGWMYRSEPYHTDLLFGHGTNSKDHGLQLGFHDTSKLFCGFYNDDLVTPNVVFDYDAWHHYACTYNAVARVRTLYRDGVIVASDTPPVNYQGSGRMNLGRAPWDWGYVFGYIDDMRIYNQALSPGSISSLAAGNP
jgi:hypothetical protein